MSKALFALKKIKNNIQFELHDFLSFVYFKNSKFIIPYYIDKIIPQHIIRQKAHIWIGLRQQNLKNTN